jgi:hypothetical protein
VPDSELEMDSPAACCKSFKVCQEVSSSSGSSPAELEAFSTFRDEQSTGVDSRGTLRNNPIPVVTIREVGKPGTRYQVRDISENGIGIIGIKARIDEMKSLAVVGDEFGEIAPFEFEAQCRWARELKPDETNCAGFRITAINEQDLLRLREFIQGFTFGLEGA